jgi:hypothetical protein
MVLYDYDLLLSEQRVRRSPHDVVAEVNETFS